MKFLNNAMFRVLDVETTGTDENAQVVEVAWADLIFESGKPLLADQFSTLVVPDVSIPPEASAIHHITDADVEGKPPLSEIVRLRDPILAPHRTMGQATVLVAHNAEFDSRFIPWRHPWLCTMRMAKRLLDETDTKSYSNQYLRYLLGLKPLCIGPLIGNAHRAAYDVATTAALLAFLLDHYGMASLAEHLEDYTLSDFLEEMSQPIRQKICHFGKKHSGEPWSDVPTSYLDWMRKNVTDLDQDTKHTLKCEWQERMGIKS